MKFLDNSYSYRDTGLLLLRIGVGLLFMLHGGPKLAGGPDLWKNLGKSMHLLSIDFLPVFWGFMAAFAEFGGGLLLILGLFSRPACLMLAFTMLVASIKHLKGGDGINGAAHAIESGVIFLSMFFIGPGDYSLDNKLFKTSKTLRKGKAFKNKGFL